MSPYSQSALSDRVSLNPYFDDVPADQLESFCSFADPAAVKYVTCDERTVEYVDRGSGPRVLLFCHGAFMRGDMFHAVIAQLEDSYRIIAPTFADEFHDVVRATRVIEEIRGAEQIPTFTMIGYSFGGAIAQYVMFKHPEWLDGVVLSHTTNLFRSIAPGKLRVAARLVQLIPFSVFVKKMRARRNRVPDSLPWYRFYDAYFEAVSARLRKRDVIRWIESTSRSAVELYGVTAPAFASPLLVLGTEGDEDAFAAMPELTALYPRAHSHVFREPGGHHYLFLHPETYARAIDRWLAGKEMTGA